MKKILTILLAAVTTVLLSSCIIYAAPTPTYTMYFQNDTTNQYIYDWYLKDSDGNKYTISDDYCEVAPGYYDSKSGLYEKDYQVWFCVYSSSRSNYDVYLHNNTFVHVNSDTTYRVTTEKYYVGGPRSAASEAENEETRFILVDSNGNKYELVSDNE